MDSTPYVGRWYLLRAFSLLFDAFFGAPAGLAANRVALSRDFPPRPLSWHHNFDPPPAWEQTMTPDRAVQTVQGRVMIIAAGRSLVLASTLLGLVFPGSPAVAQPA